MIHIFPQPERPNLQEERHNYCFGSTVLLPVAAGLVTNLVMLASAQAYLALPYGTLDSCIANSIMHTWH
jgi:hypothetical protein